MDAKLYPSRCSGAVKAPPSKSAAHRAVLCAALARGVSRIENVEYSKDVLATLGAVQQLGARVEQEEHALNILGRDAS